MGSKPQGWAWRRKAPLHPPAAQLSPEGIAEEGKE